MAETTDTATSIEHTSRTTLTTLTHRGFRYTRAWASQRKIVFRCSRYRGASCRGKLEFRIGNGYIVTAEHTCHLTDVPNSPVIDLRDTMKSETDRIAITNLSLTAQAIWNTISNQFYSMDDPRVVQGLSEQQVIQRVYRARQKHYSGEVHGLVELPPLSLVKGESTNFFQFHFVTSSKSADRKPQRIIGWAHPVLINLLRYNGSTVFIDGTFRCVPAKFAQCVIIMVHDQASGLFVPVFYVLTTSRTSDTYWDIIHFVIQATDQKINPSQVVCDFEQGIIDAVQTQFPEANVVGCLFHFKQAIRRQMMKYCITREEIAIAMEQGVLDMLTVIERDLIDPKGINWVRIQIQLHCTQRHLRYSTKLWARFWRYFRRTWLHRYTPVVWNVHGLSNQLVARTNNPLERFNRELNNAFPVPHPSIPVFVDTINEISVGRVAKLRNIQHSRSRNKEREHIVLPQPVDLLNIPDLDFDPDEPFNSKHSLVDAHSSESDNQDFSNDYESDDDE